MIVLGKGLGGSTSPLTTKGDLYGFGTADARFPVGSNGQMLTANSGSALGLRWVDQPKPPQMPNYSIDKVGVEVKNGTTDIPAGYPTSMSHITADKSMIFGYILNSYTDSDPIAGISGNLFIDVYHNGSYLDTAILKSINKNKFMEWKYPVNCGDEIVYKIKSNTGVSNFTLTLLVKTPLITQ